MAYIESQGVTRDDVWFLDSGCSNHMSGDRTLFFELDEGFTQMVKLGNHTKLNVVGKGNVRISLEGVNHLVTEVFYVPALRNNLLSIGQL